MPDGTLFLIRRGEEPMPEFAEVADGLQMPLGEAMETQRAVRRLMADPVDDDDRPRVLRLAVKAPTGSNAQTWEFVVVRNPDVKHQLARLNRQSWSLYRRMAAPAPGATSSQARILAAVQWQADHFEDVPVIVVACLRGRSPSSARRARLGYYGSIFPAVQNLLLAARALGLGAALTTLPLWSRRSPAAPSASPAGHPSRWSRSAGPRGWLRADHPPPGRGGHPPRPLREPAFPTSMAAICRVVVRCGTMKGRPRGPPARGDATMSLLGQGR